MQTKAARFIGTTGKEVFPIGLGGMPLSIQGRPSEEQGIAVVHAALDAGVDFFDTADVYCLDEKDIGHNEKLIRKALELRKSTSQSVVIATKGGLKRPRGDWTVDASPGHLRLACERSLKALGTDAIFLYQLHAPDDAVPFEDSVGELARLKSEGKILHVGLSNVSAQELRRAQKITRIESVQNRCNVYHPADFRSGLVALCAETNVTFIPYSPVGGGHGHTSLARDARLSSIAKKHGVSPYQIALAWLLAQGNHILPIPGASKVSSIQDSANAVNVKLDSTDVASIEGITKETR